MKTGACFFLKFIQFTFKRYLKNNESKLVINWNKFGCDSGKTIFKAYFRKIYMKFGILDILSKLHKFQRIIYLRFRSLIFRNSRDMEILKWKKLQKLKNAVLMI